MRLRRPRRGARRRALGVEVLATTERAVYAPPGATVEPGRYLVVVDNVCSRDDRPAPAGAAGRLRDRRRTPADEDDFEGTVTLGNQAPTVTLTGPASVPAKEPATFRATASDADGTISTYLFDLDGDGTYELGLRRHAGGRPPCSRPRGPRTIGVQVLDDAGAAAFATLRRQRHARGEQPDTRPPLTTFRLNRTSVRRRGEALARDHLPPAREGAGGGQAAPQERGSCG